MITKVFFDFFIFQFLKNSRRNVTLMCNCIFNTKLFFLPTLGLHYVTKVTFATFAEVLYQFWSVFKVKRKI